MESIKQTASSAYSAVTEGTQQQGAAASKEANKQEAQNSNAGLGERASAAANAVSDKGSEASHGAQKENAKQSL